VFIVCTSIDSHELAAAFGVGTWELGKHHLHPTVTTIIALKNMFDMREVDQFLLLLEHDFSFYYLPNG
jgi:hypothetical protein